jgi:sugar phosphate permease
MTAVANWFKRNVGKALGIMACGFGAGGILIPVIVRLIDVYQWQTTLIIIGLGMWALGIPLSFLLRHRPEQYGYLPDGETVPDLESRGTEVDFKKVLKNRAFWQISLAEAIRMMAITAVVTHVMPYLRSEGIPRSSAGLVATFIPLLSIIGRLGFGWLGDVFDKRYLMAGIFLLMGLGLLAFSYIQLSWLIFLFLIIFSPAYGGGVTLRGAIVREYFGTASFGRTLGIMMGITSIGVIIGPSLAGWTFDTLGSYRLIWLAFAATMGISVILTATIKPPFAGRKSGAMRVVI